MPPLISTHSIWEHLEMGDAVCCPVNSVVNAHGSLVMGAGLARAMWDRFPRLPAVFGIMFEGQGPGVYLTSITNKTARLYSVVSFPTKHHWRDPSDLELVRRSAAALMKSDGFDRCFVPKVGCGLGGLDWEFQVKPMLMEALDGRFLIPS